MIRLLIGVIFIFGALGGLYYTQHPKEFKEKVNDSIEVIADQLEGKNLNNQDGITMPEIPVLKNDPKELSKSHLKKETRSFTKEQMGKSHYEFIQSLFRAVLDRGPNSDEEEKWLNALLQGASRDAIYRGLTLDIEYLEHEYDDGSVSVSDDFISFAKYYLKNFLNFKLNEERVRSWNHLRLSKYVVNKSLDLIDYYAAHDVESLCRWYAVLSSDLAIKFKVFNPKTEQLRTIEKRKNHYLWAKQVPNDFIKSEVIIKVHRIFNQL